MSACLMPRAVRYRSLAASLDASELLHAPRCLAVIDRFFLLTATVIIIVISLSTSLDPPPRALEVPSFRASIDVDRPKRSKFMSLMNR